MTFVFLPAYLKKRGIPDPVIGTVFGAYSISTLLLMLPLGILSDRISPKRILLCGGLIICLHMLGLQQATRIWHFIVLGICGGMGWTIFQIVLLALFLKVIDEQNRGIKIAAYSTGLFLGIAVGPLVAGMLWGEVDYLRLLTFAACGSLILIICVTGLEDSPPIAFKLEEYRNDIKQPHVFLFLLICFVYATHLGVEHTAFTLLMKQDLGFSDKAVGLVFFTVGVWMALISPLAGRRFDVRQNPSHLLIFGLMASGVFQVATALVGNLYSMMLVRILHTMGDTPVYLSIGILTSIFFPQRRMGGNSAAVYTVRTLGIFTGNITAGLAIPWIGYRGVFVGSGLFVVAACLCLYPAIRHYLAHPTRYEVVDAKQ